MTPWIQSRIPKDELAMFGKIQQAVRMLPDLELGVYEDGSKIVLSCHILARAVGKVFCLPVQDGYFHPNCKHSWLLLPSKNIVDVYPVGMVGGPLLVDNNRKWSPGFWLYRPTDTFEISDYLPQFHFGRPCFRKAVLLVSKVLQKGVEYELCRNSC